MRRFRTRRRRAAALALLPLAALTTTHSFAADTAPRKAHIDPSNRSVKIGERVTLRGSFPDAANQPVAIRYRRQGSTVWREAAKTRTDGRGRYRIRVEPRRIGYWRAELAGPRTRRSTAFSAAEPVDRGTGTEKISVRSRTRARVKSRHVLAGRSARVVGEVAPAGVRRKVVVRIGGKKEVTTARRNGRFELAWKAPSTGRYPVRVRARTNRVATGSRDRAGAVTAYRKALASWYGPGLYGNRLGCGGTLTPSTIGVAHKSMPCGTKLTLRYRGRSVRVRVIDRGPYSGNREFDLTEATKRRLGFPDTGTVLTSR